METKFLADEGLTGFEAAWPALRAEVSKKSAFSEEQVEELKPVFLLVFAEITKAQAKGYVDAMGLAVEAAEGFQKSFAKIGQDSRAAGAGHVAKHLAGLKADFQREMLEPMETWTSNLQGVAG